jgi:transposase-like protein
MTKPLQRDAIYLKRHFDPEIIVLCVRWYITYKLSYRDLAAMMAERRCGFAHHHHALGYSLRARV